MAERDPSAAASRHVAPASTPGRGRRFVGPAVRLLIVAAVIWAIVAHIDLRSVQARLTQLSVSAEAFALALLAAHAVISAYRWQLLIRRLDGVSGFMRALLGTLLERFVTQVAPSAIGDGARTIDLIRHGESAQVTTYSVVIDRLFALGGIVVIAIAALPITLGSTSFGSLTAVVAALAIGFLLAAALLLLVPERIWERLGTPYLLRHPVQLALTVRSLLRSVPFFLWLAALSVVSQALVVACFIVIARDLGIQLSLLDAFVTVPLIVIAGLVPVSIAGWGVREGAAVLLLHAVNVASTDAVALSVMFGLVSLAAGCVAGLVWVALSGSRRGEKPSP